MKIKIKLLCSVLFVVSTILFVQGQSWNGPQPRISPDLIVASQNFDKYDVILDPDKNAPEWWAGAPSVIRDQKGVFWMACRMRLHSICRI